MQYNPVQTTGICFPGASPKQHSRLRLAVYITIFFGMVGMIAAGVDVHTAAVTILAAGYVASEIAHQVVHSMTARGALPVTG